MYTRMFLYVLIAVLTTVIAETTSSVLPMPYAVALAASLQGFIALRAFIDETPALHRKKIEEKKVLKAMSNGKVVANHEGNGKHVE